MKYGIKFFGISIAALVLGSPAMAEQQLGKIVDVKTGAASEMVALTNGASFKVGDTTYRLEIDQTADQRFEEELSTRGMPIRIQDLASSDAFTMLTHLSGVTIVCASDVDKEAKVSVNTQDAPIMSIIEQICFQLDATATARDNVIWITKKK